MKDSKQVVADFNELVNMTADELEGWLKSDDSNSAGWPKDGGAAEGGESVGHDSGRKIVEILKANPQKKEDQYTEEQVEHMRKVVAYCKRHLAQESAGNKDKSPEEVKKTKSYASLKNWGHDFLKAQGKEGANSNGKKAKRSKKQQQEEKEEEKEDEGEEADADKKDEHGDEEEAKEEEQPGNKRKTRSQQAGTNKKHETRKGAAAKKSRKDDEAEQKEDDDEDEEQEEADGEEEAGDDDGQGDAEKKQQNGKSKGKKAKNGPKPGDTVSWNWGGGKPSGKVLDVKEEETTIKTKRGNEVSRKGKPEDPAVVLDTGKSKAIKSAHELN